MPLKHMPLDQLFGLKIDDSLTPSGRERSLLGLEERTLPKGAGGLFIVALQIPLVLLIGILDRWTMHQLSLALLYQIPVAIAAWRGGFACGVFLALFATLSWHTVDREHDPGMHFAVSLWNGVVRFAIFTMTSSLLSRLRLSLFHERSLARTDPLTGAANGRTFYEAVCLAVERSLRLGTPLTVAYFDIDDFKQVNDRWGHSLGDESLRQVTLAIHRNIRSVDVLARLGGDEFAVLLPDTGTEEALTVLSRLHQLLACKTMRPAITMSVGAATFVRPPRDIDRMVRRVDALMYRAKNGGKNRLEHEEIYDLDARGSESGLERRAVARVLCNSSVRIRVEEPDLVLDESARVVDISTNGIALALKMQLPMETLVAVEPLYDCGVTTVLARIVWTRKNGDEWFYGCVLATPLSLAERDRWVAAGKDRHDADGPVAVGPVAVETMSGGESQTGAPTPNRVTSFLRTAALKFPIRR
ncbi:MAG: diguanylate cyclase [Planctomycetes bacterium]|nr:diguanylate cyclase [Planctomycetota bacterium]